MLSSDKMQSIDSCQSLTICVCIPTRLTNIDYTYEALLSVASQTHLPDEVILVLSGRSRDGLSQDQERLHHRLSSLDTDFLKTIRYEYYEKSGLGAARNYGCDITRCSITIYGDDDDLWDKDRVLTIKKICSASSSPTLVRHGFSYFWSSPSLSFYKRRLLVRSTSSSTEFDGMTLFKAGVSNYLGGGSSFAGHTEIFRVLRFSEELRFCEDWDFWLRALISGIRLTYTPYSLVAYREHSSRMTSYFQHSLVTELRLRFQYILSHASLSLGLFLGIIKTCLTFVPKVMLALFISGSNGRNKSQVSNYL